MIKKSIVNRLSCLFACLFIVGCNLNLPSSNNDAGTVMMDPSDSGVVTMGPSLTSLEIDPSVVTVEEGQSVAVTVTGKFDDNTSSTMLENLTFEISDSTIATVTAAGEVTGIEVGETTLTAKIGAVQGTATIQVTVPAGAAKYPIVFDDDFAYGIELKDFDGAVNVIGVDSTESKTGMASLKVEVPAMGYTGAAVKSTTPVDFSSYNAVSFWAKSSTPAVVDVFGIGNDSQDATYSAEYRGVALTSAWTRYVVPIPNGAKATSVQGLFHFSENSDVGAYDFWIDELQFESLPMSQITNVQPIIPSSSYTVGVGDSVKIENTMASFDVDGTKVEIASATSYFDFTSSDVAVASVDAKGLITANAVGSAVVTGLLGGIAATGTITISVLATVGPSMPAPAPMEPPADVISLFSDEYMDIAVDTWSTVGDMADVSDEDIGGNAMKKYSNLSFAGIDFASAAVDATEMTHFSIDVWTQDLSEIRIKLVDFGMDGAVGGGDDSEQELSFSMATNPPLAPAQWVELNIPLSDFVGLTGRSNIAQLIIGGAPGGGSVYVDNIYFYTRMLPPPPPGPAMAAPVPLFPPAEVTSLFSDAYTNVTVDSWGQANVTDETINGDTAKKYTNLVSAAVELTSSPIDASDRTHFFMNVWSDSLTAFKVKLIDFGMDETVGGGDDSEHEIEVNSTSMPPLGQSLWNVIDIPLNGFTGLSSRTSIAQIVVSAVPGNATVYIDNVLFHGTGGAPPPPPPPVPMMAAPTPMQSGTDVISLYSDAYMDVSVDTWSASWDQANVADIAVSGDNVKQYTNMVFAAVEFTSNPVDASNMTHFHLDFWTPNAASFKIKLVDFGMDRAVAGGDDSEAEIEINTTAGSTPPLAVGSWVSVDVPMSAFAGLNGRSSLAQMVMTQSPGGSSVYIDNVYFYDSGTTPPPPPMPTTSAPIPTQASGDVISIYSDAYTDVAIDTFASSWSAPAPSVTEEMVGMDHIKKYAGLGYARIEANSNPIDASTMTNVHLDIWSDSITAFRLKIIDFGMDGVLGGGDDSEHELQFDSGSMPSLTNGAWYSIDVPLSDFVGLTGRSAVAQFVIGMVPSGGTVYLDNFYFYDDHSAPPPPPPPPPPTTPSNAAPNPTIPAVDVISLFSDAYTDVMVDTFANSGSTPAPVVSNLMIGNGLTKRYSGLGFAGIETTSNPVDASNMTRVHMDIWSTSITSFSLKIVDLGMDGVLGGGDDSEHEATISASSMPPLASGSWYSIDLPLSDFTGLSGRSALGQYVIGMAPNGGTVFVDNFFFYDGGSMPPPSNTPQIGAPTPMVASSDVISIYSDAYTNVFVDTFATPGSTPMPSVIEEMIGTDHVQKYVGLGFAGIETTSSPIDASSMSSVHLDIWSSNITEFRLKIVDFGMDGALGGGDDSEHELKFDAMSTPALANGAWYSIDVPFTAFTGLTGRSSIQQFIIGMDPSGGTVYLDNLYFYDDHSAPPPPPPPPPPTIPTASAPTPTEPAAEVISIFSDAYMNVTVDTFATSWSAPSPVVSNIVIGSNNDLLKRYSGLGYAGLETTSNPVDATTMTHVHLDFWSTNISEFRLKIVDFGMDGALGGGDDSEHEIAINANSMPAIGNSSWYSIDLPLSSFTGLTGRRSLQRYVIGMNPSGGTVFIDNFYFYR